MLLTKGFVLAVLGVAECHIALVGSGTPLAPWHEAPASLIAWISSVSVPEWDGAGPWKGTKTVNPLLLL